MLQELNKRIAEKVNKFEFELLMDYVKKLEKRIKSLEENNRIYNTPQGGGKI